MDNLINIIRRNRIFDNSMPLKVNDPEEESVGSVVGNYNRPTPALDRYSGYLENLPGEKDYQPGKLKKLLAGIAGFSTLDPNEGIKTTRSILDEPYNRAMSRYKMKGGQLGELANIESEKNKNDINLQVKLSEQAIAGRKENRELFTALSQAGLRDADIKKKLEEIKELGRAEYTDVNDGMKKRVYPDGRIVVIGKEKLTNAEELKDFTTKEDIKLGNSKGLFGYSQGIRQRDEEKNIGLRNVNEIALVKLREQLDRGTKELENGLSGISPAGQNSALKTAVEQARIDNPSFNAFFDTNGNFIAKGNEDNYKDFAPAITKQLNVIRERAKPINDNGLEVTLSAVHPANATDLPVNIEGKIPDWATKALANQPDGHDYPFDDGSVFRKMNGKITKVK